MSHHSKYGSRPGSRNPYSGRNDFNDDSSYQPSRPRFTRPETGYGEDLRNYGREEMENPNQDIRGAGFNSRGSFYDRDDYRYERDEFLQARGGLPGFRSSAESGSGYIYNQDSVRGSQSRTGVDYTGRGPKGWKRSDERIREDVSEILERHPGIDASEIEVTVQDGIVTLSGAVDHRRSKRLVEDAIDSVSGIKDVRNHLDVNQSLFNQVREILTGHEAPATSQAKSKH